VKAHWIYHVGNAKKYTDDQCKTGRGYKKPPPFYEEVYQITQGSHVLSFTQVQSSLRPQPTHYEDPNNNPPLPNTYPNIALTPEAAHTQDELPDISAAPVPDPKKRSPLREMQRAVKILAVQRIGSSLSQPGTSLLSSGGLTQRLVRPSGSGVQSRNLYATPRAPNRFIYNVPRPPLQTRIISSTPRVESQSRIITQGRPRPALTALSLSSTARSTTPTTAPRFTTPTTAPRFTTPATVQAPPNPPPPPPIAAAASSLEHLADLDADSSLLASPTAAEEGQDATTPHSIRLQPMTRRGQQDAAMQMLLSVNQAQLREQSNANATAEKMVALFEKLVTFYVETFRRD